MDTAAALERLEREWRSRVLEQLDDLSARMGRMEVSQAQLKTTLVGEDGHNGLLSRIRRLERRPWIHWSGLAAALSAIAGLIAQYFRH